jgi:hypothetical protein
MKNANTTHFLSLRDHSRFALFLLTASILIALGMLNRPKQSPLLPNGTQLLDSKPRNTESLFIRLDALSESAQFNQA